MHLLKITQNFLIVTLFISLFESGFSQQKNLYHSPPSYAVMGRDLTVSASLLEMSDPIEAILYFRTPSSDSYLEIPFRNKGFNWEATIPKFSITDSGVEYVITFRFSNDLIISYPRIDPFNNPYFLQVVDNPSILKDQASLKESGVAILSPEIGDVLNPDEVFIAASFFNVDEYDASTVKIFLDNEDITSKVLFEDDILSYNPSFISDGDHQIMITMKNVDEKELAPLIWSFSVGNTKKESSDIVTYQGSIKNRLSSEKISDTYLGVAEIEGRFDVDFNWALINMKSRITSRENPFSQPQNRLGANFTIGSFLKVEMGDIFPRLGGFLIDGKRVRGIGISTDFGWLKFNFIQGELNRQVQKQNRTDGGYKINYNLTSKNSDGSYNYFLDRTGYTFKRNIYGFKLSTDLFSRLKLGVQLLSARDDTNSVKRTIQNSFFTTDSRLANIPVDTYSFESFEKIVIQNGDNLELVTNDWTGKKPNDNLVAGFNIASNFDDNKLKFDFEWNVSLYNRNTWGGAISKTQLDTTIDDTLDGFIGRQYDDLGNIIEAGSDPISLDDIFFDPKALEDIFIINANMTPLVPIDLNANFLNGLINMPSSAFKISLKGNYNINNILVEYKQVGPEFLSLGNPFLRSNTRQFILSDRISLFQKKLFLNVGFKHLDNKILSTTVNPLNTNTFYLNLNFIPGPEMPSFVVSVQSIGKNNERTKLDSVGSSIVDLREDSNASNNMIAFSVPFFSRGIKHNLTLNLGNVTNSDNLASKRSKNFFFSKTDSRTISLNLSSKFSSQLNTITQISQTKLDVPSFNDGQLIKTLYVWNNISLSSSYQIIEDTMRLQAGISLMDNKSQIRSQLVSLRAGADYRLQNSLSINVVSFLRFNYLSDNQGLDSYEKGFDMNASGVICSINYKF